MVKQRTLHFQNFPEAAEIANRIPLKDVVEPLETPPFTPEEKLWTVLEAIDENRLDYTYIVDHQERLVGLVTRTDLMRWVEVIAANPEGNKLELKVQDMMVPGLKTVTDKDETATAVSMMRQYGLKRLPVVHQETGAIIGMLRVENIMRKILREIAAGRVKTH